MYGYRNRGRKSWQSRGRGIWYSRAFRLKRKKSDSRQMSESTDLLIAATEESCTAYCAVTAVNHHSLASSASSHSAAATKKTFSRSRGHRRLCQAKTTIKPVIIESSSDASSTTDVGESVGYTTKIYAASLPTVVSNCEMNARQQQYRGLMHHTRAQHRFRKPMSWPLRARFGRCNRAIHSVRNKLDNAQPHVTHSTRSHIAAGGKSFNTLAAASVRAHFSSCVNPVSSATQGAFKRGRGYRRPCLAKSNRRPASVPLSYEYNYCNFEQMDDLQLYSEIQFTAAASKSVDVDIDQASDVHAANVSDVASDQGKNDKEQEYRRQYFGSTKPLSQENDAVNVENDETQCPVTCSGTTPFESRMQERLVSELMSSAEADWVDDDDGVLKVRKVSLGTRRKHITLNLKYRRFCGNRRSRNGTGGVREVLRSKHVLKSRKSTDAEFEACPIPAEEVVKDSALEEETVSKSARCEQNSEPKIFSYHQMCEMASRLSVSIASVASSDTDDLAVQTSVASEVKQTLSVDACEKNSVAKPSVHVDEKSLFWHLVDEYSGKCCIDKLRNQLNTSDADVAIAVLCNLKRIKILVNESEKWMSVAFVFLKQLGICRYVKAGCKNKNCTYLHVCPDHITDSCSAGEQCRFGHSVKVPCNKLCLRECDIPDSCSNESILMIARCSNPTVCAAYNGVEESHCHNPLQCIQFHVCNFYFCDRCLIPDSKCSLGHELTTEHNEGLLLLYEIKRLLKYKNAKKILHQMILSFNWEFFPWSQTCMSNKNGKTLQTTTQRAADKVHISDFVAKLQPNAGTRTQTPKSAEPEVTASDGFTLISDDQLFVVSAAQQISVCKAQQPVTLCRYVVGQDPTSEISDVPKSTQTTKLTSYKHSSSSGSISSEQEDTTSLQTGTIGITENEMHQLPSNENESVELDQPVMISGSAAEFTESADIFQFCSSRCQLYEKHLCNECDDCSVRHDALPYLWRVQHAGKWIAFDDSASIEQAFCSPDNNIYHDATYQVCVTDTACIVCGAGSV